MLVFPLYALAQSLVMPLLGVYSYVVLARREARPGRYRFGYRRGTPVGAREQIAGQRLALAAAASAAAA
jgi:hypothetical protein